MRQEFYNSIELYTNRAYSSYDIDLSDCNSVQIINQSTNGAMIINNFIPLSPNQSIVIDGNKNEILKTKISVFPVGVTNPRLVVVKKTYI